jgi:hypothetical protein
MGTALLSLKLLSDLDKVTALSLVVCSSSTEGNWLELGSLVLQGLLLDAPELPMLLVAAAAMVANTADGLVELMGVTWELTRLGTWSHLSWLAAAINNPAPLSLNELLETAAGAASAPSCSRVDPGTA